MNIAPTGAEIVRVLMMANKGWKSETRGFGKGVSAL